MPKRQHVYRQPIPTNLSTYMPKLTLEIIKINCVVTRTFPLNARKYATQYASAISERPDVVEATLTDPAGNEIACYSRLAEMVAS